MSWWPSTSARALYLFAAVVLAATVHAAAAEAAGAGCDAFAWPLEAERTAFESPSLSKQSSGAASGAWSEQAFELALKPIGDVAFEMPPSGKPKAEPKEVFGGLVTFGAPAKAGLYQVTLSGEGWIDVIQDGKQLPAAAHTGAKDCPGLRKSVRFEVAAKPVVLQISGAGAETIKVGVRPAE